MGELLEERPIIRDPQNLVFLLFYQTFFWSSFVFLPVFLHYVYTYAISTLSKQEVVFVKFVLTLLICTQVFSAFRVYRWTFADWLLAFSTADDSKNFYALEADFYRILVAFYGERVDLYVFLLALNFFFYFSLNGKILTFWEANRLFVALLFLICQVLLIFQRTSTYTQIVLTALIFDFRGFTVYLYRHLSLWKKPL